MTIDSEVVEILENFQVWVELNLQDGVPNESAQRLNEAAHTITNLIAQEANKARLDMAQWLNVWLIEHDQAPMDSGRISIKAGDVLNLQADLMSRLTADKEQA